MTSEQLFYDKKTGFDRLTDERQAGHPDPTPRVIKNSSTRAKTERDAVHGNRPSWLRAKGFRAWTRDDTRQARATRSTSVNRHKGHHAGCYW